MTTEHFQLSPDTIELARVMQRLIDQAVRRAAAESTANGSECPSEWVFRDEAAQMLGVKPRTIYEYIAQGKLTRHGAGPKNGKLKFLRSEVERLARGEG